MHPNEPTSSESSGAVGGADRINRDHAHPDQRDRKRPNATLPHDYADLANRIEHALAPFTPRHINRVIVLAEARSTQDEARARCGGQPGLMVITSRQTAGRGRLGRAWADTADAGIAATFVLDASLSPGRLSIIAGLAACLTAETVLANVASLDFSSPSLPRLGIRWPNDVIELDPAGRPGRKLAGVLIERADNLSFVGIGLNVAQHTRDWSSEIQGRAVSLRELGAPIRDPRDHTSSSPGTERGEVVTLLAATLNRLLSEHPLTLAAMWADRNALQNQSCRFTHNGEEYAGRVVAIDPENTIQLQDERRGIVHLPAQSTSLIHDATP